MTPGGNRPMRGGVALVTGAAGGIGAAVVRALAAQGVRVAAVDRSAEQLRAVAGGPVTPFHADVTSADDVERVVARTEELIGPISYLVNAAGVLFPAEARRITTEQWAATFAVNTTGVFLVSRAVADRMVSRRAGAIVTLASNAAHTARVEMAAYSASKAAATMFTKCLGLEVAPHGVRCNVVSPGSTDTAMLWSLWGERDGARASIEGVSGHFRVGIPLGKLADPADVADAVVFLLSDRARHITMQDVLIDGGAALGA